MQMEIEENLRQGMNHEEARRQALISLGGMEQTREACRETCAIRWAAEFRRDLAFGWRMMRKSPKFTAIAVLTLALGIGANSAIFSAVNGILLTPLPYPDLSRLVVILREQCPPYITPDQLREITERCTALGRIATYDNTILTLTGGVVPKDVDAARVSSDYFSLLGTRPLLGRTILPQEMQPGNDRVAVLSHSLWMDEFGGDTGIVGRDISVDHKPYTVVGVMPRDFGAGMFSYQPEYYDGSFDAMWVPQVPLPPRPRAVSGYPYLLARLKEDATLAQLNAQLKPLSDRFAATYPAGAGAQGLRLFAKSFDLGIDPRVQTALWILLGAVGFVLLMACVNVTSLLVARSWTRQRELAIRSALGATRLRILRQLLAESLLLALAGCATGLFFSTWGIHLVRVIAPPDTPRVDRIRLDAGVLWFTIGISLLVGVLVGLAPALQASSRRMGYALKNGLGGSFAAISIKPSHHLRRALVILEVLLAVILAAGGMLMGRSFYKLMSVDTGLSAGRVLTMRVGLSDLVGKDRDKCGMAASDILNRIRSLSGVQQASLSSGIPLHGASIIGHYPGSGGYGLYVEGREGDQIPPGQWTYFSSVTPGYFAALGIRLLRGRDFEPGDRTSQVAVVSQEFARKYIQGDPLGKRFSFRQDGDGRRVWMEIVGVVNDVRDRAIKDSESPTFYTPFLFLSDRWRIIARTSSDPMLSVPAIVRVVQSDDREARITNIETLDQILANSSAEPRFQTALVGSFGVLGLLLAVIGVYGVISYSVVQRTHEIGVRMALGAQRKDVLYMILREGMLLAVYGTAAGIGGALALTRVLRGILFEIGPTDPATFVGVAIFLTIAALAACYIPARRATCVDPMLALRSE
jgi:putative ABC transport system permease protein